jgi:hypothetical protein
VVVVSSPAGEFLSLLGFRLGTSSRIQAGLYLETALVGVSMCFCLGGGGVGNNGVLETALVGPLTTVPGDCSCWGEWGGGLEVAGLPSTPSICWRIAYV